MSLGVYHISRLKAWASAVAQTPALQAWRQSQCSPACWVPLIRRLTPFCIAEVAVLSCRGQQGCSKSVLIKSIAVIVGPPVEASGRRLVLSVPSNRVQGWDLAHQQAAADRQTEEEAAAAALAEMCQRAQDLGERFYPNEAGLSPRLHWHATCRKRPCHAHSADPARTAMLSSVKCGGQLQ